MFRLRSALTLHVTLWGYLHVSVCDNTDCFVIFVVFVRMVRPAGLIRLVQTAPSMVSCPDARSMATRQYNWMSVFLNERSTNLDAGLISWTKKWIAMTIAVLPNCHFVSFLTISNMQRVAALWPRYWLPLKIQVDTVLHTLLLVYTFFIISCVVVFLLWCKRHIQIDTELSMVL